MDIENSWRAIYLEGWAKYAVMVFRDGNVEQRNDATIEKAVEPVEDGLDISPRQ